MTYFANIGGTLFQATPFVRWTLGPCLLIFAAVMPFAVPQEWTPTRAALMLGLELICFTLLAGFWLPARYGHSAFRVFSGVLSLGYAAYLIDMTLVFAGVDSLKGEPGVGVGSRGVTPFKDLMRAYTGFAVMGLPGLWFALFGRFTRR